MSDYTPQPGRGTVFKNTEADAKSSYSGKICLPDGTMAFCDLYLATDRDTGARRTDKNGNPWLNIRVKPMAGGGSGGGGYSEPNPDATREDFRNTDLDDEVPFISRKGLL
jgi:hypothetical protein